MKAEIKDGIVYSPYPDFEDCTSSSVFAYLHTRMKKYGEKTALIHGRHSISYSQLLERLKATAAGFRSHGIRKGDRVLVHVKNSIDSFVAAYSIPLTGAAVVTSDVTLSEDDLLHHVMQTEATHVVTDEAFFDIFKRLVPHLKFKTMFSITEIPGFVAIRKFCSQASDYKEVLGCEDNVMFVVHSTGTTGGNKVVEITQRSYLLKLRCREIIQFATSEDVCLGGGNISFKVCFTYGHFVMSIGATLVILDKYNPVPDVFTALRDHKVSFVFGTPMKILEVALEARRAGLSFPHVKKFALIGTPMTKRVKSEILLSFSPLEFRSCYGMVEANGCLAAPPHGDTVGCDVGFPVPGTCLKVVDTATGAVLGSNQVGEVHFHAPRFSGYYRTSTGSASVTHSDGWIHTGDLGFYNEDGRLHLMGRLNTVTLPPDLRTALPVVEECLHFHPSVAEAAVVPNTGSEGKGHLAAIVVARPEHEPSLNLAEDLKNFVKGCLPKATGIEGGIFFADAIPRGGFGKVKRARLPALLDSLARIDSRASNDRTAHETVGQVPQNACPEMRTV